MMDIIGIYNHIAFVVLYVAMLFYCILIEVKAGREFKFDDDFFSMNFGFLVIALTTSYLWFIVLPLAILCGIFWLLVQGLKILAKALVLATAQKNDKKVVKND